VADRDEGLCPSESPAGEASRAHAALAEERSCVSDVGKGTVQGQAGIRRRAFVVAVDVSKQVAGSKPGQGIVPARAWSGARLPGKVVAGMEATGDGRGYCCGNVRGFVPSAVDECGEREVPEGGHRDGTEYQIVGRAEEGS